MSKVQSGQDLFVEPHERSYSKARENPDDPRVILCSISHEVGISFSCGVYIFVKRMMS